MPGQPWSLFQLCVSKLACMTDSMQLHAPVVELCACCSPEVLHGALSCMDHSCLPDLRPDEPCCPTDEALMRLISRVVELEGPDGEPTPPDEV